MIPKDFITEWRRFAPWPEDAQVEQDLVISRALASIFQDPTLARRLAFRGGTALYKLHILPAARYSEDIDLVQVDSEPIGDTFARLRQALDAWLGEPKREQKQGRVNLVYRFQSEDVPPVRMRLKLEIDTREHYTELGLQSVPFEVDSRWFSGKAVITTFDVNELFGTKLRALYQRKKGRDLFDLWLALEQNRLQPELVLRCFQRCMAEARHTVSRAEFEQNLERKAQDADFRVDIAPLLRVGQTWDFDAAFAQVRGLIAGLPGEPWKGRKD